MEDRTTMVLEPTPFVPLRLRLLPGVDIIRLDSPDLMLGRHSSADLCLPLPDVSRQHCRFVFTAGGWEVIDLGSLNGVSVNGDRIVRSLLHAGDRIRICSTEFEVVTAEGAGPTLSVHRLAEALASITRRSA